MDTLPSSQFRKVYSTLTEPVQVTVNGHAIGFYQPISTMTDARALDVIRPGEPPVFQPALGAERFNSQPFRGPIPKRK